MRKSHKTVKQLEAAMFELYGVDYGAQKRFADDLGKHEVSVSRWMNKKAPVDKTTAKLIDELVAKHRAKIGGGGALADDTPPAPEMKALATEDLY